jgi:hypothetical protein
VRRLDRPAADVERRGHDPIGLQELERKHRADDVDDRIDRADFVQVDFADRHAVHLGFGLAESLEERLGSCLPGRAQRRPVDQAADVGKAAVHMKVPLVVARLMQMGRVIGVPAVVIVLAVVVGMRAAGVVLVGMIDPLIFAPHAELCRADARADDPVRPDGLVVYRQAAQRGAHRVERHTGIDQRAEDHVA